jgi:phage tail tape-measure protein
MPALIKTTAGATGVAGGANGVANVKRCDFVVSGTFVATWQFQALINDAWETIAEGTVGGAYLDVHFAEARQVRFNVSAWTSGTVGFSLAGIN